MAETGHITVKLTPKAARNEIQGWAAGSCGQKWLKCTVTAPPDKGKANAALIALLAEEWDVPKSALRIVRGETSRLKTIEFQGVDIRPFLP